MSTALTSTLSGYRETDRALLTGHWLPGELLGVPLVDGPALLEPRTVPPPGLEPNGTSAASQQARLCVVRGAGFVRFVEIDWVDRRARLEIGLQAGAVEDAKSIVDLAVAHAFTVLALRRVHGWVTPAAGTPTDAIAAAGFRLEGLVPQAIWFDGGPVGRELWGVVRDD